MNWDQIEGLWKEYAGSARAHWAKLTGDDWQAMRGRREELAGLVQQRYGIAKEEAERQVDDWARALTDHVRASKEK